MERIIAPNNVFDPCAGGQGLLMGSNCIMQMTGVRAANSKDGVSEITMRNSMQDTVPASLWNQPPDAQLGRDAVLVVEALQREEDGAHEPRHRRRADSFLREGHEWEDSRHRRRQDHWRSEYELAGPRSYQQASAHAASYRDEEREDRRCRDEHRRHSRDRGQENRWRSRRSWSRDRQRHSREGRDRYMRSSSREPRRWRESRSHSRERRRGRASPAGNDNEHGILDSQWEGGLPADAGGLPEPCAAQASPPSPVRTGVRVIRSRAHWQPAQGEEAAPGEAVGRAQANWERGQALAQPAPAPGGQWSTAPPMMPFQEYMQGRAPRVKMQARSVAAPADPPDDGEANAEPAQADHAPTRHLSAAFITNRAVAPHRVASDELSDAQRRMVVEVVVRFQERNMHFTNPMRRETTGFFVTEGGCIGVIVHNKTGDARAERTWRETFSVLPFVTETLFNHGQNSTIERLVSKRFKVSAHRLQKNAALVSDRPRVRVRDPGLTACRPRSWGSG